MPPGTPVAFLSVVRAVSFHKWISKYASSPEPSMAPTGIGLEQKEQKKILDQSPGRREADSSSGCGDTSGFGLGGALWLCSPRWRRENLRSRYLGSGGWISGPKYSCVVWYRRVRAGARVTQGHTNLHSIQTFGSWGGQAIAGALFEAGSQMMVVLVWCLHRDVPCWGNSGPPQLQTRECSLEGPVW